MITTAMCCPTCESVEITFAARVLWDFESQQWVIYGDPLPDTGACENCEATGFEPKPIRT